METVFDLKRKSNILKAFNCKEINKAYVEGIYADTPANRKLGRVGMSYTDYAAKVKKGEIKKEESNDLKDFKKETIGNKVEYSATIEGKKIKISQEGTKRQKYWTIVKNGSKVENEYGIDLKFDSAKSAIDKVYSILEEEKNPYAFPTPDYLYFDGVRWINPNESDTKVHKVYIHRYGKGKPEITISPKNSYNNTIIVLKNSEMRKLLVSVAKKEDLSMSLNYSKEDMKNWVENQTFDSKEIKLSYNAKDNTITYKRTPVSKFYTAQNIKFSASALDKVLNQFKKENMEDWFKNHPKAKEDWKETNIKKILNQKETEE